MTGDDLNWGGVGFYLPITFHNRGPRGCSILELRMLIKPKSNPTRCFDISWTEFSEISTHEETLQRIWNTKSIAQPISIEGKSSISKTVLFAWDPQTTENLEIQSGQYEITLLAWTDETAEADLRKNMSFRIDDNQVSEFRKYAEEDLPLTIEIPLGESRRDNSVITKEEAHQLYG